MTTIETIFVWAAIFGYFTALVAMLLGITFRKEKVLFWAHRLWPLALLFQAICIAARWIETGHGPVMYAYENAQAASFIAGLLYLSFVLRYPQIKSVLPVVLSVLLLLLGNGLLSPASLGPLEPPFRSSWLVVHVLFAWIAFGSFVFAAVLSWKYLRLTHKEEDKEAIKAAAIFDDLSLRLIALGFVGATVMIASGAIWAHSLWGRYWAWDPVETWSLVTWLVYGVHIHLRFTLGWSGRRAAWLSIISVAAVIITFFGLGVISDVHTELL